MRFSLNMSEKKRSFWRWIGRIFRRRPPSEEKSEKREEQGNDRFQHAELSELPPESSKHYLERVERKNPKIYWDKAKTARLRKAFLEYEKQLKMKTNFGGPSENRKSKIRWKYCFCCFGRMKESNVDVSSGIFHRFNISSISAFWTSHRSSKRKLRD
ncbi:uncharacterized protein LOC111628533 [Centruroides sculpturatus]|uniref:uncharacterized protein LOC111628533 n=1 Tax=Centruroides sculpturatus TaxID=218467 RepID=UPI000C6EA635|nr:uncharacterized protein LOC111628533 [Centruroides sculpturatus]